MPSPQTPISRRIRSFVMRAGRMTPGQERGWRDGLPCFGPASRRWPLSIGMPALGLPDDA